MASESLDAVVVGSGPNGLSAAITMAMKGLSVLLLEGAKELGGGLRTEELTIPGFIHDVCASVHALGVCSPFFRSLALEGHGLKWVFPPAALAHPFEDGSALLLRRGVENLENDLGQDGSGLGEMMEPILRNWEGFLEDALTAPRLPRRPLTFFRFGLKGIFPARTLAEKRLKSSRARALFAGLAAHSVLPLERPGSAAAGLLLGAAAVKWGWPLACGGSRSLALALSNSLRCFGGEIQLGRWVRDPKDLPKAKAVLFDLTPRNLARSAPGLFPPAYFKRLQSHPLGPGVFKMDWALSGPIPWKAQECFQAATVHLGGTVEEIADSEKQVWEGKAPEKPFVLLVQPSLFDSTRAPEGKHVAWAYCHVPNGYKEDMSGRIESQIERFAPGFRDRILARSVLAPKQLEEHNPNYVGGDFLGGPQDPLRLMFRPLGRWMPYRTPLRGYYICSSCMPPGGGVHGMCGHNAAKRALAYIFR